MNHIIAPAFYDIANYFIFYFFTLRDLVHSKQICRLSVALGKLFPVRGRAEELRGSPGTLRFRFSCNS